MSGLPDTEPFVLRSLTVEVYRAPITRPLRTSFGTMTDRPSVIVRATASDGTEGYGEAWCNFPLPGAEHRARLIASFLAPEIVGREWPSPAAVYDHLTIRAHALSLQAGEPGPLPQAIAGIDIALWDVVGRRAGEPLWRLLEAEGGAHVQTYASGIGPAGIVAQALDARAAGHRAFKLKIGFGQDTDLANIEAVRRELGPDAAIAVDADQAWSLSDAARMSSEPALFDLMWLEEPIPADSVPQAWLRLAEISPVPLAAGENLRGSAAFDAVIGNGAIKVIQPDVAKWGGISGCLPLGPTDHRYGPTVLPHYLGVVSGSLPRLTSLLLWEATGYWRSTPIRTLYGRVWHSRSPN